MEQREVAWPDRRRCRERFQQRLPVLEPRGLPGLKQPGLRRRLESVWALEQHWARAQ